jgi:hypothetical protein
MKKAQIEMMGLVVIVLILAIGFLFLVSYLTRGGERESAQQIYQKELLGYNTIGAILQADAGCKGNSIAELIEDCVSNREVVCSGADSCAYTESQIIIILNETLGQRNQEYFFYVWRGQENPEMEIWNGLCLHNRVSATQPYTSRAGEIVIGVDIC